MFTLLNPLSEAATTAIQAVILPTATVRIAVAALALMPRRYATQQQAAAHFHVSDRTIRNKIAEGLITGYRIPGSRAIRVDLDEIDRLMQVVPAAIRPRKPFGPKARIVTVAEVVQSQPTENGEVRAEASGND